MSTSTSKTLMLSCKAKATEIKQSKILSENQTLSAWTGTSFVKMRGNWKVSKLAFCQTCIPLTTYPEEFSWWPCSQTLEFHGYWPLWCHHHFLPTMQLPSYLSFSAHSLLLCLEQYTGSYSSQIFSLKYAGFQPCPKMLSQHNSEKWHSKVKVVHRVCSCASVPWSEMSEELVLRCHTSWQLPAHLFQNKQKQIRQLQEPNQKKYEQKYVNQKPVLILILKMFVPDLRASSHLPLQTDLQMLQKLPLWKHLPLQSYFQYLLSVGEFCVHTSEVQATKHRTKRPLPDTKMFVS